VLLIKKQGQRGLRTCNLTKRRSCKLMSPAFRRETPPDGESSSPGLLAGVPRSGCRETFVTVQIGVTSFHWHELAGEREEALSD